MSKAESESPELGQQVTDAQTRIFLKLVFDIWEALERYNQFSASIGVFPSKDQPTVDRPSPTRPSSLKTSREDSMNVKSRVSQLLMLALAFMLFARAEVSVAQSVMEESASEQSISEQKKAVVFIFGTIHPLNPDRTPMTAPSGTRVAVDLPLGTGFLVSYPDWRRGPDHQFSYLVTARHVLQDVDGTLLPSVSIRVNLKSPSADSEVGFIRDLPVTDAQGDLLWLHGDDPAEDVVVLPLSPDQREFDFTTISTRLFLNNQALNSGAVAEGDDLYFIGLMEQYYGVKRNHPLVRRGTLALLTDESIETPTGRQQVFIAELESWPGNSGSPVFLRDDRRDGSFAEASDSKFLGMLVASFLNRFSIPLNGQQPGQQLEAGDKANTGMTCIVPAAVIERILESASAQQDRDVRIWRGQTVAR